VYSRFDFLIRMVGPLPWVSYFLCCWSYMRKSFSNSAQV
jgi:hypothetical protein